MRRLDIYFQLENREELDKMEFDIFKPDESFDRISSESLYKVTPSFYKAILQFNINKEGYYKLYPKKEGIISYFPKAFEIKDGILTKYYNISPSWFHRRYSNPVCLNQLQYELKLAGFEVNDWKARIISIEKLLIFKEKYGLSVFSLKPFSKKEETLLNGVILSHSPVILENDEITPSEILVKLPQYLPFPIDIWLTGSPILKGRGKYDIDVILTPEDYKNYKDKIGLFLVKMLKREVDVGQRFPENYPRVKIYEKGIKVDNIG